MEIGQPHGGAPLSLNVLFIMTFLRLTLLEITDLDQPGWVECEFIDIEGRSIRINDKLPVITDENLWVDDEFPRQGSVACTVINKEVDDRGCSISEIDIGVPWGLESTSGEQKFKVSSDDLFEKEW